MKGESEAIDPSERCLLCRLRHVSDPLRFGMYTQIKKSRNTTHAHKTIPHTHRPTVLFFNLIWNLFILLMLIPQYYLPYSDFTAGLQQF